MNQGLQVVGFLFMVIGGLIAFSVIPVAQSLATAPPCANGGVTSISTTAGSYAPGATATVEGTISSGCLNAGVAPEFDWYILSNGVEVNGGVMQPNPSLQFSFSFTAPPGVGTYAVGAAVFTESSQCLADLDCPTSTFMVSSSAPPQYSATLTFVYAGTAQSGVQVGLFSGSSQVCTQTSNAQGIVTCAGLTSGTYTLNCASANPNLNCASQSISINGPFSATITLTAGACVTCSTSTTTSSPGGPGAPLTPAEENAIIGGFIAFFGFMGLLFGSLRRLPVG